MKNAIILHGKPSKEEYFNLESPAQSNKHWLPWTQKQLIVNGVLAQTPEMPEPYEPVYEKWCSIFEQFGINEDTILVGHSCGAGFLVRWLSENKRKVGKVALVAPWLDVSRTLNTGFFDFEIDEILVARTAGTHVFFSSDDNKYLVESAERLRVKLKGAEFHEFTDRGHFTFGDMKTVEFPELRDTLIK